MKSVAALSLCLMISLASAKPLGLYILEKSEDYKLPPLRDSPHQDCGSKATSISFVVNDCTVAPCPVYVGKMTNITITFSPDIDVSSVALKATAYLGVIPIPFKVPNPDGCKEQGLTCPLKKGVPVTFKGGLVIPSAAPVGATVKVKWEMVDQAGADEVCEEVGVHVAG